MRIHSIYNYGAIVAVSKVQTMVSLSATESETIAAVEATKKIIWYHNILEEVGHAQNSPTKLYTDNASMIALANTTLGNHKRTKHFIGYMNFINQAVRDTIIVIHLNSPGNTADVLTKVNPVQDFLHQRDHMLGSQPTAEDIASICPM